MTHALSDEQIRGLSVRLEELTGFDSIPTIEAHYQNPDPANGRYRCVFPGCRSGSRTALRMWHHVHWEHAPKSFAVKYGDLTMDWTPG